MKVLGVDQVQQITFHEYYMLNELVYILGH
jgi:hypothetical protein